MLWSRYLLVIYFIYIVVRICQSWSLNLSLLLPLPLGNHVCFLRLRLYFCFVNRFICTIFLGPTYKLYRVILVFLGLTDFTQYHNLRSIHVSADGIIMKTMINTAV